MVARRIALPLSALCAALFLSALPARAEFATFDAGGETHVIDILPKRAFLVPHIQDAIERSIATYQALWAEIGGATKTNNVEFSFFIHMADQPGGANAILRPATTITFPAGAPEPLPDVCDVTVFNHPLGGDYLFMIAHEVAHCYQEFYVLSKEIGYVPGTDWWAEGSASWMAFLAIPETPYVSANGFDAYTQQNSYARYVFAATYDGVFFWNFLASPTGLGSPQAAIEFLRNMPAVTAASGYEDYLRTAVHDLDQFFANYAAAVGRAMLPHTPLVATSGRNLRLPPELPYDTEVDTQPFSIDFYTFRNLPLVPDGGGILFDGVNLDGAGLRANLLIGAGTIPIDSETPVLMCHPILGDLIVGVSRSVAVPNGGAGLIRLRASDPGACTGPDKVPPAAGMALIPDCLAGNWRVIAVPPDHELLGGNITNQTIIWRLEGDGDYTIDFSVTATTPQANTIIHAAISGHLGLQPSVVRGNSYDVVSATGAIVPGTATGVVQVGGIQVDATPILNTIFTDMGNLLPVPEFLTCTGPATMDYVVVDGGAEQIWRMVRL